MDVQDPMYQSVMTPVLQWIWERELYHQVIKINVFKKFRLWKAFTMWKLIVRNNKSSGSRWLLVLRIPCCNK